MNIPRRRITVSDVMKMREQARLQFQQASNLSKEHITKIKAHDKTKEIHYADSKAAYDYVDSLFPQANVKDVIVYRASRKFLDRLGYKGIGGFFNILEKVVVIPDEMDFKTSWKETIWSSIKAKLTQDEVIAHELLHYVSDAMEKRTNSTYVEEEFAYGNSYGYLKSKGYTDEYIIEFNFLPYLIRAIDSHEIRDKVLSENGYDVEDFKSSSQETQKKIMKKVEKDLFKMAKEKAMEMGREIISIYSDVKPAQTQVVEKKEGKRIGMMDLL